MYLTYLVIFVQTLGEIISQELFLSSLLDLLSKKKKILEVGRWKKLTINDTQYRPQTLSVRDVYFHFIFRW